MARHPCDIPDPWWARVRDGLALVFVCSWRGHDERTGFDGGFKPCRRCKA